MNAFCDKKGFDSVRSYGNGCSTMATSFDGTVCSASHPFWNILTKIACSMSFVNHFNEFLIESLSFRILTDTDRNDFVSTVNHRIYRTYFFYEVCFLSCSFAYNTATVFLHCSICSRSKDSASSVSITNYNCASYLSILRYNGCSFHYT